MAERSHLRPRNSLEAVGRTGGEKFRVTISNCLISIKISTRNTFVSLFETRGPNWRTRGILVLRFDLNQQGNFSPSVILPMPSNRLRSSSSSPA